MAPSHRRQVKSTVSLEFQGFIGVLPFVMVVWSGKFNYWQQTIQSILMMIAVFSHIMHDFISHLQ